jgi:MFS transporter, PAT family, beta-lactamase induction signal transducer AmpG
LAFASATHDIAADGFYITALAERQQAFYVGVRNAFYRVAMISGQGGLVLLTGQLRRFTGDVAIAWSIAFGTVAFVFCMAGFYHWIVLPRPADDRPGAPGSFRGFLSQFVLTFLAFFRKPKIMLMLSYLLLYRFAEAQLAKMVAPFLLDVREAGGLGLNNDQVGIVYGTVGVIALLVGGIAWGIAVSRQGLKSWLWPMACAIHLPDAVFLYLAYAQPENLLVIAACVVTEQLGYGFGFTAYMLYMIYIARGEHNTAHYAICTGFMALGMMLPGMWSGWLQEQLGYQSFFAWVMLATIPGFLVTALIPLDPGFGRRRDPAS